VWRKFSRIKRGGSGADPGIEYRGGGATKILTMKEIKHKKTANFISIL
jgi:hypothetical protein